MDTTQAWHTLYAALPQPDPEPDALYQNLESVVVDMAGALIAVEDGKTFLARQRIEDTISRLWLIMGELPAPGTSGGLQ